MSADNWTVCPRCVIGHNAACVEATQKAEVAYGVLPADEWRELEEKARKMAEARPEQNFREDYAIYGADKGIVKVSYSGACGKCGLSLKFKHEVPIEGIRVEAP